jgi:hypothetical protein
MPDWPATLPTSPLLSGFNEQYEDFNASFEPDVGLPSTWPRSAMVKVTVPWTQLLTNAQRVILFNFWKDDCATGSLPFDITDPVSLSTVTVKFMGGIRFAAGVGPRPWLAEFTLMRLA